MKKAIFVTVRTSSTRLPGKCLLKIKGLFTIQYVIRMAKKSKLADLIVLTTSDLPEDDALVEIAQQENIEYFRGSKKDKLERWRGAAEKFGVEFFVTADGDDLFCEPELIDMAFRQYEKNKPDFIEREDLVCGAFSYAVKTEALEKVCQIKDTDDTELMSVYFTDTGLFKCEELEEVPEIYKRPELRATLDYLDDFKFFETVINDLEPIKQDFNLRDVIRYLDEHPQVIKINQDCQKKYQDKRKDMRKLVLKKGILGGFKRTGKFIGNELKYVKEVLESEMKSATSGSWNNKLEKKFAEKFGVKYAIACNSGTSGLHACLSACGVGPGDEVISPALTVIMDTLVILYQNAIPIYADVDPKTFNIDPKDIEKKITKKTKAIITVSLYGLSPDMDPIMEIAKKHNLFVIEDNAQCVLGTYKGRVAGSIGHMSVFSFENSKHISVGEGGMIITNDEMLAERARKCAGIGYKNLKAEEGRVRLDEDVFQNPHYKRINYLGWNYRMPEINAAIGFAQIERLDELVNKRIQIAKMYKEAIKGCDWMIPQFVPDGYTNSYYTYSILYKGDDAKGVSWEDFYKTYKEKGGDGFYGACSIPYLEPLMSDGNYYGKGSHYTGPKTNYKKGLCLIAEQLQPKLMQFKTNYRDLDLAETKTEILRKTIEQFNK